MALDIAQAAAISFPKVLLDQRKPANQWKDSTVLNRFQEVGILRRENLGQYIEFSLDYRRNQSIQALATDMSATSLAKTEVFTAAVYDPAEISENAVWSKLDDAKTADETAKFAFTEGLITNALDTHDDFLEECIFTASTNGLIGLPGLFPTSGQGNVGGIDASIEVFWRHPADTYLADGSDIDAVLTTLWNSAAKGSGSKVKPSVLVSGSTPWALFESQQGALRVYDGQTYNAGAITLKFKTATWDFSQFGDDEIYGLSPKSVGLVVSKTYFRAKGETVPLTTNGVAGFAFPVYSALQMGTGAKSRAFVASQA